MMDGHHKGPKKRGRRGCKDGGVPVLPACLSNVQKGEIKLMTKNEGTRTRRVKKKKQKETDPTIDMDKWKSPIVQ